MKDLLEKVVAKNFLSRSEASLAMSAFFSEQTPVEQIAGLLVALRTRQESPEEVIGFLETLEKHMLPFDIADLCPLGSAMDVCGTGGDGLGSFNISTTVGLVLASMGIPIVKHGNRAVSSSSGSADVLEKLGFPMDFSIFELQDFFKKTNFVFLLAPVFHPVMAQLRPIRKNLGIKTVFNILGPLLNPAGVEKQLLGVFDLTTAQLVAEVLLQKNKKYLSVENSSLDFKSWVVYNEDGLDELSMSGQTHIFSVEKTGIKSFSLTAQDFGFAKMSRQDCVQQIRGGNAEQNAQITLSILQGQKGLPRDIVVLNAAAALVVAGEELDFLKARHKVERSLDNSASWSWWLKLQDLIKISAKKTIKGQ